MSTPLGKNPNFRFCPKCGTELESFGEHSYHKCAGCMGVELQSLQKQLDEEIKIVNTIWGLFGNPSYESLKGKSIYDLITELRKQLDEARDKYNAAQDVIDKIFDEIDMEELRKLARNFIDEHV